jgi:membrane fusion protein (multidrug efflux system)
MGKAMEAYLNATNELELGIGTSENVQKQLILMEEAQSKSEAASSKIGPLKAELNLLEAELKKTACLAPFDGIVLKRFNHEGSVVSFGDAIYTLCDPHRVWVEAEIRETDIGRISIGTPARIHFSAYPKKEWMGHVSYIGAATVDKSHLRAFSDGKATIPIKISLEKADASLKPGLSARVDLKIR